MDERAKDPRRVSAGRKGGKAHSGRVGQTNAQARSGSHGHERQERKQFRAIVTQVVADILTGRPPDPTDSEQQQKLRQLAEYALKRAASEQFTPGQLARALCEMELVNTVAFWVAVRDGAYAQAEISDRIRCAENLANRGGLPIVTAAAIAPSLPQKIFEVPGLELGEPVNLPPPDRVQ